MHIQRKSPFALEDWLVEPEFNRLSRGKIIHRVEPKVMSVLLQLAAQPQCVLSKEEILRAVWLDTFVSENVLTRCISVLRHILKDNHRNPRFIKTVSKAGYCLLVTARPLQPPAADFSRLDPPGLPEGQEVIPATAVAEEATPAVLPESQTSGGRRTGIRSAASALSLALVIGLAILAVHATRAKPKPSAIRVFQLTTNAGEQSFPVWSPDGKRLAFVWAKEDGGRKWVASPWSNLLTYPTMNTAPPGHPTASRSPFFPCQKSAWDSMSHPWTIRIPCARSMFLVKPSAGRMVRFPGLQMARVSFWSITLGHKRVRRSI